MDDQLRRELEAAAKRLVDEHRSQLEAVGTLADIEDLTAEIGDELGRQVANLMLEQRSRAVASEPAHCPGCGAQCPLDEREAVFLQGSRGDIEYQEPRYHCTACRRSFFPCGRPPGSTAAREFDGQRS